mgnify:CR=1 FL=1
MRPPPAAQACSAPRSNLFVAFCPAPSSRFSQLEQSHSVTTVLHSLAMAPAPPAPLQHLSLLTNAYRHSLFSFLFSLVTHKLPRAWLFDVRNNHHPFTSLSVAPTRRLSLLPCQACARHLQLPSPTAHVPHLQPLPPRPLQSLLVNAPCWGGADRGAARFLLAHPLAQCCAGAASQTASCCCVPTRLYSRRA